jgi:hypothetical protein
MSVWHLEQGGVDLDRPYNAAESKVGRCNFAIFVKKGEVLCLTGALLGAA